MINRKKEIERVCVDVRERKREREWVWVCVLIFIQKLKECPSFL